MCDACVFLPGPRSATRLRRVFGGFLGAGVRTSTVCAAAVEIGSPEFWSGAHFFCCFMQIFHEGSDGEEEALLSV